MFVKTCKSKSAAVFFEATGNGDPQLLLPEYAGHADIKRLFGVSRAYLYQLQKLGLIKSANVRRPGNIKGRRLWYVPSIRALLENNITAFPQK